MKLETIEQDQHFKALRTTLVEEISRQLGTSAKLAEAVIDLAFAGQSISYDWMWKEAPASAEIYAEKLYNLQEQLSNEGLVLDGLHFPAVDESLECDYRALLECIPTIQFVRCHFYSNGLLDTSGTRRTFSECTFHSDWKVAHARNIGNTGPLFDQCCFKQRVELIADELGKSPLMEYTSVFSRCDLNELVLTDMVLDISLFDPAKKKDTRLASLDLKSCTFEERVVISKLKGAAAVVLRSTVFNEKFTLIGSRCRKFVAVDTNFEKLADFYESQFHEFHMEKSIFRDFAGFEKCAFGVDKPGPVNPITLRYVTFYSFINFREARFNQALDLRATNRQHEPNFLDAAFSPAALNKTDRETFRIIKHSFDAVGNRIEANKYFAHEMQAYRRELNTPKAKKERGNCRERFLLGLNAAVSSHGQDYGKALFWLGAAIAVNAAILANHKYQWWLLPEPVQSWLWNIAAPANEFANGFLPLRSLLSEELQPLAFWVLIAMVAISSLTWNLLVAVRRHARR